jgi:UDP-N-acetylmuramoyl-L-alanyl-D-glutamate--2,6-diaminopimelate ligase
MGRAATALADVVVLTSDNPRHEEPLAIIAELQAGGDGRAEVLVEPDRRRAIALGLGLAGPGDVVVVAGKGHETKQQIGDYLYDFDDREVVRTEAARLAAGR